MYARLIRSVRITQNVGNFVRKFVMNFYNDAQADYKTILVAV